MSHHRARRLALQGLCCLDVQGGEGMDLALAFVDDSREAAETIDGARQLLTAGFDARRACDDLLARHARNWDLERLALVDRNILRLACHELIGGRVPARVVIAEALKLAQEFSSAQAPRFINGVLDAVAKELAHGARAPGQEASDG